MPILYGIDGTGPGNDHEYTENFRNSFVRTLCKTDNNYNRGPNAIGSGLMGAIDKGVNYVERELKANAGSPVLLTGYSRGAAGAVVIAKRLKDKGINVAALLMFDCVDRHMWIDSSTIPNTVGEVLHIRRNKAAGSRESFGNSGTKWSPPTVYVEKYYLGTHGSMGGTFWKPKKDQGSNDIVNEGFPDGKTKITFAQDKATSAMIWGEIQPFLNKHNFI